MDLDVEEIMLRVLETEKRYLSEDLEDYGCAMVAVFTSDNESYRSFPDFDDEQSKSEAYEAIVKTARAKSAVLIVTVNNARTRSAVTPGELDQYELGDLDEHNSQRCILLTAIGPGLQSNSMRLGYKIVDGQVRFGDIELDTSVEVGLLPGWPDDTSVGHS